MRIPSNASMRTGVSEGGLYATAMQEEVAEQGVTPTEPSQVSGGIFEEERGKKISIEKEESRMTSLKILPTN